MIEHRASLIVDGNNFRQSKFSRQRGSTFLLTLLLGCLVFVVLISIVWFSMLMVAVTKSRAMAEERALNMAASLNRGNCIGELNQITSYSRQLVYTSRQVDNQIIAQSPQLKRISALLLDDARSGAAKVNQEFDILKAKTIVDVMQVEKKEANTQALFFEIPMLKVAKPQTESIALGTIDSIPSNARLPESLADLKQHDQVSNFNEKGSQFYRSNIDARLPLPDNDLTFRFSCLMPAVGANVAQLRLMHPQSFKSLTTMRSSNRFKLDNSVAYIPCAVQLNLSTNVQMGPASLAQSQQVQQQAIACTSGALPDRD